MRLIIDAYNVLHTVGVLPEELADIDLAGLIALIRRSRYRAQRVDLVCDGTGPRPVPSPGAGVGARPGAGVGARPGAGVAGDPGDPGVPGDPGAPDGGRLVAVHYSGRAREADDVIIDMVAHISYPRQVVVVSSDRRIVQAARRRRCGTLTAAKFLHRLALDRQRRGIPVRQIHPRPRGPLRADEVDEWIREFDLEDHELADPPDSPVPTTEDRPKAKPVPDEPSRRKKKGRKQKGKRRQRATDSAPLGKVIDEFPDDVLAEADDLTRDGDESAERGRGSGRKKGKSKRKSKVKKKRAVVEPPKIREVTDEFPDDVLAEADDLTRDRDADEPS